MTFEIKHAKVSAKSDGVDNTLVQPSDWNAALNATMATDRFLGRVTGGAGAVEELTAAQVKTALGFSSQKFHAYLSATLNNFDGADLIPTIPFNMVRENEGGVFNTGTNRPTAPFTGVMRGFVRVHYTGLTSGSGVSRIISSLVTSGGGIYNYNRISTAALQIVDANIEMSFSYTIPVTIGETIWCTTGCRAQGTNLTNLIGGDIAKFSWYGEFIP